MKKLLFLVGLIMVTTACTIDLSKQQSKEEDKESNFSLVAKLEQNNTVWNMIICQTNYDDKEQVLYLNIQHDGVHEKVSYPLSDINEAYVEQVKHNKVTTFYDLDEFIPAVVEKGSFTADISGFEQDTREFTLRSILKGRNISRDYKYFWIYQAMFSNGFCKMGDQVLKNGRFFFAETDTEPETTGKNYADKGAFSAGLALYSPSNDFFREDEHKNPYQFSVIQTFCDNGYLVVRAENGNTYRYPFEIFEPDNRYALMLKKQFKIAAIQLSNTHWIPVRVYQDDKDYTHEGFLWKFPYISEFKRINSSQIYNDFLREAGIASNPEYKKLSSFFYSRNE